MNRRGRKIREKRKLERSARKSALEIFADFKTCRSENFFDKHFKI